MRAVTSALCLPAHSLAGLAATNFHLVPFSHPPPPHPNPHHVQGQRTAGAAAADASQGPHPVAAAAPDPRCGGYDAGRRPACSAGSRCRWAPAGRASRRRGGRGSAGSRRAQPCGIGPCPGGALAAAERRQRPGGTSSQAGAQLPAAGGGGRRRRGSRKGGAGAQVQSAQAAENCAAGSRCAHMSHRIGRNRTFRGAGCVPAQGAGWECTKPVLLPYPC